MTRLPQLHGRDLTGAARTLPDDLAGTPAVLLVGFAEVHQAVLDLWFEVLDGVDVPVLEVPVAPTRSHVFARFIEGGMVPGVPAARHATTVVVYTDVGALVGALGLAGPVPAAVALDADGAVCAVEAGPPDGPGLARVVRSLSAASP